MRVLGFYIKATTIVSGTAVRIQGSPGTVYGPRARPASQPARRQPKRQPAAAPPEKPDETPPPEKPKGGGEGEEENPWWGK
jgi:hypothetical protein